MKSSGDNRAPGPEDCWAKTTKDGQPGISVRDHCLNVGCVAEALIAALPEPLRALLPPGAATLAALHDVGKISPGFLMKCPAWLARFSLQQQALHWVGSESNHAKVSQHQLQTVLPTKAALWSVAAGAHHGRILGRKITQMAEADPAFFAEQRARLVAKMCQLFGPLPTNKADDAALWFFAGLITVADWFGSDERRFPLSWPENPIADIALSRQCAATSLSAAGWQPASATAGLSFAQLFSFSPNPLQQEAAERGRSPGLYLIEGPMGCGKTEAALHIAYELIQRGHHHGIFFGLPTQVTSNRIHRRVRDFVCKAFSDAGEVRLAHAASWLHGEEIMRLQPAVGGSDEEAVSAHAHAQAARSWFASAKRALLAQFGVGTVDQALLGIVAANHFFVRQFGLAGKVVILDEVHSYDLYTGTLLDRLIERLLALKCSVIVLSATLTDERRRQLLQAARLDAAELQPHYPLLSGGMPGETAFQAPVQSPTPQQVFVRCVPPDTLALAEECLARAARGACVLWIRNTVADAQETFRSLLGSRHEGGPQIGLLHSRFPFFRREQLEEQWLGALGKNSADRPRGCVLVSTQVVEQSVDIDADFLVTDLAPTDMLLQRLGRLWRHPRGTRPTKAPEAWIACPEIPAEATADELRQALGKSARVYAPYVLLRSWKVWRERASLALPDDIRNLLEATYSPQTAEPSAWNELHEEIETVKAKLAAIAEAATRVLAEPALKDEEGVQTRWSNMATAQVLLACEIEPLPGGTVRIELADGSETTVSARDWSLDAARAIHGNLVKLPFYPVGAAVREAPDWLRLHANGAVCCGQLDGQRVVLAGGSVDFALAYDPSLGLEISRQSQSQRTQTRFDDDEPCD